MQRGVAGVVSVGVVDRFEMIEIERQHADRLFGLSAVAHELGASFEETAPIEQIGQWICCCRLLVVADSTVLCQHEHDNCRANDIEHDLDRIDRTPAGAETEYAAA